MSEKPVPASGPRTLWAYVVSGLFRRKPHRPIGLFLMAAMMVALFFGVQFLYVRDDPKRFAFFLILYFVFFLVVIVRAILEFFDIIREHVREREGLFRETFAKDGFSEELGRRVARGNRDSWPEI